MRQRQADGRRASAAAGCSRRAVLALGAGAAAYGALRPLAATAQSGRRDELTALSATEAATMIASGAASPSELTRACLERIERLDPLLNAFITVAAEHALGTARQREAELARGISRGPLHGVPIALKDNIDTAGIRTTGASEVFRHRVPTEDAEVVRRLAAAGAVLLGKLNLHELAYGGSSTVTAFGAIHNPWALDRATGGSSGGPGAAVAADLCYAALGTDTAGSVRIPAAHCGIVGLKPTYGRVAMRGVMTLSWTLDHVGPMCKTVADAAVVLGVIAGYDPADPTTADAPVPDYAAALALDTRGLRIGIPRSPFWENLHPEVEAAAHEALRVLGELTAGTVDDVTLPALSVTGNQLWGPEAYAYHLPWITSSPDKYQPSTRASLERYADAPALDYVQARREVDLARRRAVSLFADVDFLVTPTMREPPPLLDEPAGAGNNAAVFNLLGLPAISLPCGFTASGLPIGLQIVGAPFAEERVLALAHAYERATEWHRRKPDLGGTTG